MNVSSSYTSISNIHVPHETDTQKKHGAFISARCGNENQSSNHSPNSSRPIEEKVEIQKLKTRDSEVKSHEMAHIAAGGQFVRGSAQYEYQIGPDGKQYVIGGEVSIDCSAVSGDPKATITKMQTIRKAALAPANPSGQDRAVASQATSLEAKARKEIAQQDENQSDAHTSQSKKGHEKNASHSEAQQQSIDIVA